MKGFFLSLMMFAVLPWGEIAVASPGPFYDMGEKAAKNSADTAWSNLGKNCRKLPTFVQIIEDSKDDAATDIGTKYKGQSAKDFGLGYQAGLSNVLMKVCKKCRSSNKCQRSKGVADILVVLGGTDKKRPSSSYSSFYNLGENAAKNLADNAWRNLQKPKCQVTNFITIIEKSKNDVTADIGTKYKGQAAKDFGSGYIAGLSGALDRVKSDCPRAKKAYKRAKSRLDKLIRQLKQAFLLP